jgi:hypothetical protein
LTGNRKSKQPQKGKLRLSEYIYPRDTKKPNQLKRKLSLYTVMLADPDLSDGAVRVAGALLFVFHNTTSGQCFPSNASVARVVGMHEDTISRHVSKLVKAGYVLRDRRHNTSSLTDFDWTKGSDEAVQAVWEQVKSPAKSSTGTCKIVRTVVTKTSD